MPDPITDRLDKQVARKKEQKRLTAQDRADSRRRAQRAAINAENARIAKRREGQTTDSNNSNI